MANEYYQLATRWFAAGQFCETVFNYVIADPSSSDDFVVAQQLVEALDDGVVATWIGRLQDMMSDTCFLSTARARRFKPTGGNTAVVVFEPGDFPGSISDPIHSQQVAACINWIPVSSSFNECRNFIPGIPTSALDGSRFESSYQTAADLFIAQHLIGFTVAAGLFLPVSFNRDTNTGGQLQDGYLSPKVGTQRRRERSL